jgi:hypothetical protein
MAAATKVHEKAIGGIEKYDTKSGGWHEDPRTITSRRANFGSAPPSRVRWFHTSECDLSPRAYRYEVDDVVAQPTLGPLVSDSVIANTRGVHVWERIWRLGMRHAHRHDAQNYPLEVSIRQSIVF